jgi:hypothetical protein
MVEANSTDQNAMGGSTILGLGPIDKSAALGLFREAELDIHLNVVLRSYI